MTPSLTKTLSTFSLLLSTAAASFIPKITSFGPVPKNTSVTTSFTYTPGTLDSLHISALNDSVYEWWYFDAVSADLSTALVIAFFITTAEAFPLVGALPSDVSAWVWATYPNGTTVEYAAPASSAQIAAGGFLGDAAAGSFLGSNPASFEGTSGLGFYEVSFDFTEMFGVKGSLTLESRAPAHLPCTADLNTAGSPLQILPGIGYTNAVPDAVATGSFTTTANNKTYTLTDASGYHDKNWGSVPFFDTVNGWYWGRVHLGPYTLQYFSGTGTDGSPFATAYVAHNGQVLVASCAPTATKVTPTMKNKVLKSLEVEVELASGKMFKVVIEASNVVLDYAPVYERWIGSVSGGIVGGQMVSGGASVFERFYPQS